ncbi:MAG: hypothetical protein IH621_12725 [Krumholzibacteria bacterium]|nr:hypothetical protein [Candidatus Krumholzibacteria bacterium]
MAQGIGPRVRSVLLSAAVGAALLLPLVATAANSPDGTWVGQMKSADGEDFEVTLVLDGMGTTWSGKLSDPYMGEVALQDLKVTATRISFTFRPANVPFPANFSGSYLAAGDRITGTFSMRGSSRFVKFERSAQSLTAGPSAPEEPAAPVRVRHDYRFALTARAGWWPALHLVKDENYNINNLTAAALNFDGAVKWSVLDEFTMYARYYRGGQAFTDDDARLAAFAETGLSGESYLALDGWEIGLTGYLGDVMMRNSRFNPYVTAAAGMVDWELGESGRGTEVIVLERNALEGSDPAVMFGIGTEYELSPRAALEFEWAWRYFLTEDEDLWPDPDNSWSNTHAWNLSLGLTWGF